MGGAWGKYKSGSCRAAWRGEAFNTPHPRTRGDCVAKRHPQPPPRGGCRGAAYRLERSPVQKVGANPPRARLRALRYAEASKAGLPHRRLTAVRPAGSHIRGWLIALTAPQAARPFGGRRALSEPNKSTLVPPRLIRCRPTAPHPFGANRCAVCPSCLTAVGSFPAVG